MEKFTRFEDKSNGINPFVSNSLPKSGSLLNLLRSLVGGVLFLIRTPIVLFLLAVLGLFDVIFSFLGLKSLKTLFCFPVARLLLFVSGYFYIHEKVPDPRRLGFGKLKSQQSILFGANIGQVGGNDWIIANNPSFVVVLYAFMRFQPVFCRMDENGDVSELSLPQALTYATTDYSAPSKRELNVRAKEISEGVRLLFPEIVSSNGNGILRFASGFEEKVKRFKGKIHLLGTFHEKPNAVNYHLGGFWKVLFNSTSQLYHSFYVNFLPSDLIIYEDQQAEKQDVIRETLAKISGKKVKCCNLGVDDYFAFLDFYHSYNLKEKTN